VRESYAAFRQRAPGGRRLACRGAARIAVWRRIPSGSDILRNQGSGAVFHRLGPSGVSRPTRSTQ
jgi:hypothetical protein